MIPALLRPEAAVPRASGNHPASPGSRRGLGNFPPSIPVPSGPTASRPMSACPGSPRRVSTIRSPGRTPSGTPPPGKRGRSRPSGGGCPGTRRRAYRDAVRPWRAARRGCTSAPSPYRCPAAGSGGNLLHHRAGEEVARPAAGGFPLAQQGIPDQPVPGVRQFRQPGKVQVCVVVALENPVKVVVLKSVAEEGQHLGRKPVVRVRGVQPYGIAPFPLPPLRRR